MTAAIPPALPPVVPGLSPRDPPTALIDQLQAIPWTYAKIFGVEDVPPPPSLRGARDARVVSVNSQYVARFNGRYVMLFGVGTTCNTTAGNDSIALAESYDGIAWTFIRYLLEPDARTCAIDLNSWPAGMIYQVSDPALLVESPGPPDGEKLWVFYTAAEWHPHINGREGCGNIGVAAFDADYVLVSRNDTYLSGKASCTATLTGYSRPDLHWGGVDAPRLWFDVTGTVFKSVGIPRWDQPVVPPIRDELEHPGSGNLNTPRLGSEETLLLQGGIAGVGPGIVARSRPASGGAWRGPSVITQLSGEAWDSWYHGAPALFVDELSCKVLLYFSGMRRSEYFYGIGSIAVAIAPEAHTRSFRVCGEGPPRSRG